MGTRTLHFKVDNGDMALVEFESGRRLLALASWAGVADTVQGTAGDR